MSTPYNPRIKFIVDSSEYDLGQMSWFNPSYEGNVMVRTIPRAKGVQIYSGEELGGGIIRLNVQAFKVGLTRLEIEQYLLNLITNIANKEGTLEIEGTLTLENCFVESITPSTDSNRWSTFTINFVKSI